MRKQLLFLGSFGLAAMCQAGEWSGTGDLGFNQISGNSNSESLAAALGIKYEAGRWTHAFNAETFTASQTTEDDDGNNIDSRSAERYGGNWQSDFAINERTYAFGAVRYITDNFAGFESQTAINTGLGRTFIDDETTLFEGSVGAGYRQSDLNDGGSEDEAIGTLSVTYNRALTGNTDFESLWLVEAGSENTYAEGGVALKIAMSEALGIRLSYVAKHNTDAPEGSTSTDRFSTISLSYTF